MKGDLFFLKKAKEFDIDKMEIHPLIKSKWNKLCEAYSNNPTQYEKRVQMLLDMVEFKKGIKNAATRSGNRGQDKAMDQEQGQVGKVFRDSDDG